ncbi:MAG TPA: cupin domain-containing protein [Opitutus sp.]|nr:cupin domain-containing protein [Opitutus sp.]
MNAEAASIIARLGLAPLPGEGGFFRRTWTGPARSPGGRASGTAIYFLLTATDFSALHRLETDEVWCSHAGDPIEHVQLVAGEPAPHVTVLGDVTAGHEAQLVVPGGVWQGARLAVGAVGGGFRPHDAIAADLAKSAVRAPRLQPARGWALLTCFMAPGWDGREFMLGERTALQREFPAATSWIAALTR